jgi:hypothetical protein
LALIGHVPLVSGAAQAPIADCYEEERDKSVRRRTDNDVFLNAFKEGHPPTYRPAFAAAPASPRSPCFCRDRHENTLPASRICRWPGRRCLGAGADVPDTTEDTMLTKTSLFASALLFAAAPAFAQAVSGTAPASPGASSGTARSAVLAAPASGATQPAGPAVTGAAKPSAERQAMPLRPAQDGKVAGQPAQPAQPSRTN